MQNTLDFLEYVSALFFCGFVFFSKLINQKLVFFKLNFQFFA
jgi:hypothetical protein